MCGIQKSNSPARRNHGFKYRKTIQKTEEKTKTRFRLTTCRNNGFITYGYPQVMNPTDKDNLPDTPEQTADTTASTADYYNKVVVDNYHNDHPKPDSPIPVAHLKDKKESQEKQPPALKSAIKTNPALIQIISYPPT